MKAGLEAEQQRVRDFKSNALNFEQKTSLFTKLPEEVFRLEQVYQNALDQSVGPWPRGSLSAFEFVNMCLYYQSESYPTDFAMQLESLVL